jgi:hypothetical protein
MWEDSARSGAGGFRLVRQPANLLNPLQYSAHRFANFRIARANRRQNVNMSRRIDCD